MKSIGSWGTCFWVHVICISIYLFKCPSQNLDATGFKRVGTPATVAGTHVIVVTGAERCQMRVPEKGEAFHTLGIFQVYDILS